MTSLDISHPDKRLVMSETPPADLRDQIKESILNLVPKENITVDKDGNLTFKVDTFDTTMLNVLLYQARLYKQFDHRSSSVGNRAEYTIYHPLFPELIGQAGKTRNEVQKVAEA